MTKPNIDNNDYCPICNITWKGQEIPEDIINNYSGTHWTINLVGIEWQDKYDGVSEWICINCGSIWNRFTNEYVRQDKELAASFKRDNSNE